MAGLAFDLGIEVFKASFFDREKALSGVDKKKAQALNRIGARVRLTARRSMRKGTRGPTAPAKLQGQMRESAQAFRAITGVNPKLPKPSTPGAPPRAFHGALREGILYTMGTDKNSVLVGPDKRGKGTPAGKVLEFGGYSSTKKTDPFKRLGLVQARVAGGVVAGKISKNRQSFIQGFPTLPSKKRVFNIHGVSLVAAYERTQSHRTAPRPFMAPALKKNLPFILKAFGQNG